MAQPVQPVVLVRSRTGCASPVEDRLREAKKFLSLSVAFSSQSRLNLNRLRTSTLVLAILAWLNANRRVLHSMIDFGM
uniref:Uncharacterized protein n=1 Tax=Vitis vinifera TaxID=29760 RepID=A5AL62_VITVI|nr:hypothetical protein VITISV_007455 [Vitis vinifera]